RRGRHHQTRRRDDQRGAGGVARRRGARHPPAAEAAGSVRAGTRRGGADSSGQDRVQGGIPRGGDGALTRRRGQAARGGARAAPGGRDGWRPLRHRGPGVVRGPRLVTTTAAATGTGAPAATPELVRQLVRGVHQQFRDRGRDLPRPLIIGARAQPVWEHGPVDDPVVGRIHVAACATPLAARAAIAERGDDAAPLVLLTHLEGSSLGADLQARLVRPYLLGLSPWNAVCQRFGVRELDPEFGTEAYKWMADPLLEVPEHLMPRTAGVLTVDTALRVLSEWVFGAEGTSVERLLAATADPGFASHVASFEPPLVGDLCDALAARLGPTGERVLAMIRRGHGERALSVGLACPTLVGSATGSYGQAKVQELDRKSTRRNSSHVKISYAVFC